LLASWAFADGCPHVTPVCSHSVPPLVRLHQASASARFPCPDSGSALALDQLNDVLRTL
jgi:hypothetical protein